jgi:hypothetical protein
MVVDVSSPTSHAKDDHSLGGFLHRVVVPPPTPRYVVEGGDPPHPHCRSGNNDKDARLQPTLVVSRYCMWPATTAKGASPRAHRARLGTHSCCRGYSSPSVCGGVQGETRHMGTWLRDERRTDPLTCTSHTVTTTTCTHTTHTSHDTLHTTHTPHSTHTPHTPTFWIPGSV